MPVSGLLKFPLVLLLDNSNFVWAKELLSGLKQHHFKGKIYILAHYTNPEMKAALCQIFPALLWRDVGSLAIYETMCCAGNISPLEVSFHLLADIVKAERVWVLAAQLEKMKKNKDGCLLSSSVQQRLAVEYIGEFCLVNLEQLRQKSNFVVHL